MRPPFLIPPSPRKPKVAAGEERAEALGALLNRGRAPDGAVGQTVTFAPSNWQDSSAYANAAQWNGPNGFVPYSLSASAAPATYTSAADLRANR